MGLTGWIILVIVNIPVYFGLGRLFFRTWGDFVEAVCFCNTPDIFSAFRGQYYEDRWASLKMTCWLLLCLLTLYGEYDLITKYSGN